MLLEIEAKQLYAVAGGATLGKPGKPGKPRWPNMGAPEFSADWWKLFRARGLEK